MNAKSCPNCQKQNVINALVCAYCGSTFTTERTKTVQLQDDVANGAHLDRVEHLSSMYKDVFMFFMAHQPNPLVIAEPGDEILIGRYSETDGPLAVDLEEFGGAQLGVSRRHAKLLRDMDGCKLQDLDSKNGTWLNGVRIEPEIPYVIRSGDEIRLGQMIVHVYFNRTVAQVRSIVIINTKYTTDRLPHSRLTSSDLMLDLGPYLQAVGETQNIINDMQKRPDVEVSIDAIVTDKQSGTISVTIDGAGDALNLLRDYITPWKREHRAAIEAGDEEMKPKQKQLVIELVTQVKPDLEFDDQLHYAERLLPVLRTFIYNNCELSVEQPVFEI